MANEYWLSDAELAVLKPLIPTNRPAVKPGNNWQVISGILHVLKFGCRWRDCPEVHGPRTTIYNRPNSWSKAGNWRGMFNQLIQLDKPETQSIDITTSKAHRCSAGGNRTVSVAHTTPI